MRILFINHAFPGIFGELASAFATAGHEVLFASGFRRREFSLPGVRHIVLPSAREGRTAGAARQAPGLEAALAAGGRALHTFARLADMGLVPDMVLLSAGDGYGLFCEEVFPRAFRVGWAEAQAVFPGEGALGDASLARHLLQCHHAVHCHAFVCLGTGDPSPLAARLSHGLDAPYAVNTRWFSPGTADRPEVVLFYTGRQKAETALPAVTRLLHQRDRCHAVMLCEGRAARESWHAARDALPHNARLHLPGSLGLKDYRDMLRLASLLVCTQANSLPVSTLLEAMSCGVVPVLPQNTGPSFLKQGQNVFFYQTEEESGSLVASLLEARAPREAAQAAARATIVSRFDGGGVTPLHMRLLLETYETWKAPCPSRP